MDQAALRALIKTHGLSDVEDILVELAKPAIHMHPSPVDEVEALRLGESRLGGHPDLPAGFVWPEFKGVPLTFIGQFRLSDFSSYDIEGILPKSGLLYFFYELDDMPWGPSEGREGSKVYFLPDENTPLIRTEHPTAQAQYNMIQALKAHRVAFSEGLNLPSELTDEMRQALGHQQRTYPLPPEEESYYELVDALNRKRGHFFLGYPAQVQGSVEWECVQYSQNIEFPYDDPNRQEIIDQITAQTVDWQFLFQIDTDHSLDVMWGDMGALYVCIPKASLAQQRFEDIWVIMQCS